MLSVRFLFFTSGIAVAAAMFNSGEKCRQIDKMAKAVGRDRPPKELSADEVKNFRLPICPHSKDFTLFGTFSNKEYCRATGKVFCVKCENNKSWFQIGHKMNGGQVALRYYHRYPVCNKVYEVDEVHGERLAGAAKMQARLRGRKQQIKADKKKRINAGGGIVQRKQDISQAHMQPANGVQGHHRARAARMREQAKHSNAFGDTHSYRGASGGARCAGLF